MAEPAPSATVLEPSAHERARLGSWLTFPDGAAKHWLLGSIYWAGTCTDTVNGGSTIDGTVSCGSLSVSAAVGAGTAVGSDYGISTALVEAVLVE